MMWSKGFAADETKTALARATELAARSDNSSARLAVHYGQCAACIIRGEMREAEAVATRYLQEAEVAKDRLHAACARTWLGVTRWCQGKLSAAQATFEHALAEWSSAPDGVESLGDRIDPGVHAASYLASVVGLKGDLRRTRKLAEEAVERAAKLGHVQTTAHANFVRVQYDLQRRDPAAALHSSERATAFARKHGMEFYAAVGAVISAWARVRLSLPHADIGELRQSIADYVKQGNKFDCLSNSGSWRSARRIHKMSKLPTPQSRRRWFKQPTQGGATPIPTCIAFAATSCSSAIPPIPRSPKRLTRPPSSSQMSRTRAVLVCKPRCRWQGSTKRLVAPPKPTPSSRRRSKGLRRRRTCRRSARRRHSSRRSPRRTRLRPA